VVEINDSEKGLIVGLHEIYEPEAAHSRSGRMGLHRLSGSNLLWAGGEWQWMMGMAEELGGELLIGRILVAGFSVDRHLNTGLVCPAQGGAESRHDSSRI
jgi:hypothetical protein